MRGIDMHIGNVGYFCVGASGGGIDLASGIVEVKRFILQRLLLLSLSLVMLVCVLVVVIIIIMPLLSSRSLAAMLKQL